MSRPDGERAPRPAVVIVVLVVVGLAVTATFGLGRAYRSIADPTTDLTTRPAYVSAPDPVLRAEAGLDPNSTDEAPGVARADVRTIEVSPGRIDLLAGGLLTRTIPFPRAATTPGELVDTIADDAWIRRSTPTEVVLDSALVMGAGTTLTVAPPLARLVLGTRPGVFLGGAEATLVFTGVGVEASDRAVPKAGEVGPGTRPFVLAEGGRMEITNSAFRYLGRDWNGSYGVSWTKGAGGYATGSTFEHGYMGIFAATAIDVRYAGNTVRDNALYGINAHKVSAGVLIEGNAIANNGRDGILLSDHVIGGSVTGNDVRGNGADGIMVTDTSDGNVVAGNTVAGNRGDGIALAGCSRTTVTDNTISDNRVAVDVYGGSAGTTAAGNTISDNGAALQGVGESGNTVLSNGDYWRPWALVAIWLAAAALITGLVHLTRWRRATTTAAIARSNHERALVGSGVTR